MKLQLLVLVAAGFTMAIASPSLANEIPDENQAKDTFSQELFIANKSDASDLGEEIVPDKAIFNSNPDTPDFTQNNTPKVAQGFGSLYTRKSAWYVGGSLGVVFPGNIKFDDSTVWRDFDDLDLDNDGVDDSIDDFIDFDKDGLPESITDQNGDNLDDTTGLALDLDSDNDGKPNYIVDPTTNQQIPGDEDWQNDGVLNEKEILFGNQFEDKEIEDVLSTGFGGSLFAGYEFNKRWAIDLEAVLQGGGLTDEGKKDFNSNTRFQNKLSYNRDITEDEGTQNYFVSAFTINPRFMIPIGETETKPAKWSIFISPGIGVGTYSWKQGNAIFAGNDATTRQPVFGEVIDSNLSKTSVAFQVKAGAAYRFNYGFEAFAQVRYLMIPNAVQYVKDDLTIDSKSYTAFSPEIGMRFRF